VKSIKTAFKTALRLAKVSGRISPHTLRHTNRKRLTPIEFVEESVARSGFDYDSDPEAS
jgi:hypothetical protein